MCMMQVGNLEDSNVYIRMKSKAASEVHIAVQHIKLPRNVSILVIHLCTSTYKIKNVNFLTTEHVQYMYMQCLVRGREGEGVTGHLYHKITSLSRLKFLFHMFY